MGCCSVTQRHTGVDEVGPDEIELLELPGDSLGVWSPGDARLQLRNSRDELQLQPPPAPRPPAPRPPAPRPPARLLEPEVVLWGRSRQELHQRICSQQPIRGWEGQAAHLYGEVLHSSLVSLWDRHSQETSELFLVLFSFHLLILSLDHSRQDFTYQGILPLSGLSVQAVSLEPDTSHSPHGLEISGPMMEPKVFACAGAADLQSWLQLIEDRRCRSMKQLAGPAHCALSYLLPCDEPWKREELKKYLLHAPIWQWEGSPIQHMGQPVYMSEVHITNSRQGHQERLLVLFPQDLLLLSVDSKRLNMKYEGRLARHSVRAVERSALLGRLEFELTGELLEPLLVSCSRHEDYGDWMFHLQQLDRSGHLTLNLNPSLIVPKLEGHRKDSPAHQRVQLTVQRNHPRLP
ncbi:pleckstrin homology domain-containing family N member 1 isoform X1 [Oryzias melastigma]|uniref:pleckstrin homology domain-containing family N member 1 isoform X1 n=1 Tax=Oryzias melastigma TaxID=30732 RepID=UPI000CF7F5D9|nr:pleckstrin homology domain-containing family N member 1 isoform X1 [Oryzias melastigma]XP_024136319.1 pleckstrin homology domain-containing family N member 1 isoform X1 [Oryzias melastigma]XP_036068873.1 pleckstrin homology domain-containing family N member 1 isoform X1 [Oryzias melastigma]